MPSDKILIEGIEFYGYHGDLPEERELGQRYVVDLALTVDCSRAGRSDQIEETVDYAAVAKRVDEIGRKEQYHLIEGLAERIAEVILKEFAPEGIRVRVSKPAPPIPITLREVSVEIFRERT